MTHETAGCARLNALELFVRDGLASTARLGADSRATADRARSLAPAPPESSGSYRASGGGSRACLGAAPRRASAPEALAVRLSCSNGAADRGACESISGCHFQRDMRAASGVSQK